ncbi:MAG: recombinase family protein [Patescibacteria group bacterium]
MKNQTCIIYCRVSDKDQQSVPAQEKMCREYALKKDFDVEGVFVDQGKSGTQIKYRDGLHEALVMVEEIKVNYFLITETDRFARNSGEHYMVKDFLRKQGCKLIAVNQPYTETDSVEGDLIDGIMANVNEFYSKLYGNKVRAHMKKKIEAGELPGWAPVGYRNKNIGTKEKPHNIIVIDEEQADLVVETFNLYSTGNYNSANLCDIMHQKGLRARQSPTRPKKKMARSTFLVMLRNPFYYGMLKYKGKLYRGAHKPIIDKATFDACQKVLDFHNQHANRERKHSEKFFLRQFLRCGICGGKITAECHEHEGKKSYYHCSHTKKRHSNVGQNITSDELERLVADEVGKIQISKPLLEKIVEKAHEILEETHSGIDKKKRKIQNQITALEQRRNNLEVDRLDRKVSFETYQRQHSQIEEDLEQLNFELQNLKDERADNVDIFNRFTMLTDNLKQTYLAAKPNLKV